jgi:hypothetical protein
MSLALNSNSTTTFALDFSNKTGTSMNKLLLLSSDLNVTGYLLRSIISSWRITSQHAQNADNLEIIYIGSVQVRALCTRFTFLMLRLPNFPAANRRRALLTMNSVKVGNQSARCVRPGPESLVNVMSQESSTGIHSWHGILTLKLASYSMLTRLGETFSPFQRETNCNSSTLSIQDE